MIHKKGFLPAFIILCLLFLPHLSHAAWQWENPLPMGEDLQDAWGSSATDIYLVGYNGTALYFDGSGIQFLDPGTNEDFTSVFGVPGGKVYIGGRGVVSIYDPSGDTWSTADPGITQLIYDIDGISENDYWVVGSGGAASHYLDGTWTATDINGLSPQNITDIACVSSSVSYVIGGAGEGFYSTDGSTWNPWSIPASSFYALWADSSSGDVIIAGPAGQAYLCTSCNPVSPAWTAMDTGTTSTIRDLWGNSSGDVFAAGDNGNILHYDGNGSYQWTGFTPPVSLQLNGIAAFGSGGAAVGLSGAVATFDGSSWAEWGYSATYQDLYGIGSLAPDDVYAVGDAGTIAHFNGISWASTASGTALDLADTWVSPGGTVYVVGGTGAAGLIAKNNGSGWALTTYPQRLLGIYGYTDTDVYVSGNNGTILHYDGSSWTPMTTPDDLGFIYDIWGASPSEIWAVTGGRILFSSGSDWSVAHSITPITAQIRSVWGSSSDDVYAVGDRGVSGYRKILHYDGTGWSDIDLSTVMSPAPGSVLYKVWGTAVDNVFFMGANGTVFRYDGAGWHLLDQPIKGTVRSAGGSTVTVVGDGGAILTYSPDCPAGYYLSGGQCLVCTAGSYCPGNDSTYLCPPGEFGPVSGGPECYPCPAATYNPVSGATQCIACPVGSIAPEGSTSCTQCPSGSIVSGGGTSCSQCPAGTEPDANRSSCVPCPAGEYNGITGGVCTPCESGYVSFGGATECAACTPGTYSSAGGDQCIFCDAGTFSAGGASTCEQCPGGTFSILGASTCDQCDAGTFSTAGSGSCAPCDAGSYSAAGSSTCDSCNAGTYSAAGAPTCDLCAAGSFSAAGASDCTLCPAGQFAPNLGSSTCLPCPGGEYAPFEGYQSCDTCDPGTYSLSGAAACTTCDAGSTSATGSSTCETCDAGTFSAAGDSTCTECVSGTVSSGGADSCTQCLEGTEASADASTCDPCPVGSSNAVAGSFCQQCPEGTYSDITGAVSCTECPEGYTSDPGSSQCVPKHSGGGGGCNTIGPPPGEPMWPEFMWIMLLGMVMMWRRRKAVQSA